MAGSETRKRLHSDVVMELAEQPPDKQQSHEEYVLVELWTKPG